MKHDAHYLTWLAYISRNNPNRFVWLEPGKYYDALKCKVIQ